MNFNICPISLGELTPDLEREIEDFSEEWKTSTPSWTALSIVNALRSQDTHLWIVQESMEAALLGLALIRTTFDEAEILYLHVAKERRRLGVGLALIGRICHDLTHQLAVTSIFLEVRSSNESALKLYDHSGFKVVGRRPTYYHDG
ncbi:MAG: GNAT family N-acetyltransferase, partial [Proteobacteria bacterium]|nr:GNAT family N-acetyltransferase [Pseudomonadota bacterium]